MRIKITPKKKIRHSALLNIKLTNCQKLYPVVRRFKYKNEKASPTAVSITPKIKHNPFSIYNTYNSLFVFHLIINVCDIIIDKIR